MEYRIGWLFEHPTLSGGERSALEMIKRLGPPYVPVALAPPTGPLAEALTQIGCAHVPHSINRRESDIPTLVAELTKTARTHRIDLLHANTLSMADLAGLSPVRSIGHIREIGRISGARMKRLLGNERLLAVSDATAQNLIDQGAPPHKLQTCYNGIDLRYWDPERWRAEGRALRAALEDRQLLLSIGQLGPRKGQDLLLSAFAELRTPAELWIIGARWSTKQESIDYETALHERAAAIDQPVRFLGYREDIPALLAAADLLVHPARQEPLGRVILEAMAMDCPIVATAVGGTPEMLDARWLTPTDDSAALAVALRQRLRDAQPRLRAHCEQRFSVDYALTALRAVYDAIMGE